MKARVSARAGFGDFQTPPSLAKSVMALLDRMGVAPSAILEPTCGTGNLLFAAAEWFPNVEAILGVDISAEYVRQVQSRAAREGLTHRIKAWQADFFEQDWQKLLAGLPEPLLVVGNPPWVTNAALGALGVSNLPAKSNFDQQNGLEAITGKSNFDISEWMLLKLLEAVHQRRATVAVLCKTAIARKLLARAMRKHLNLGRAKMFLIDAQEHFGASVDACLFVCEAGVAAASYDCDTYVNLNASTPAHTIGQREGIWVSDLSAYDRWRHLQGQPESAWRSGIKHDCSKVMELTGTSSSLRNGLGEAVTIEDCCLYPLLKGSDVFHGRVRTTGRWMLVPQQSLGQDTSVLRDLAPLTWQYLEAHAHLLDKRKSSVYAGQPPFAIFGVGDYSFSEWKVAVSGLHKEVRFRLVGPISGKPAVFDDTCYFLPCRTRAEALVLCAALSSSAAREFYAARIFSDTKRAITKGILQDLDPSALLEEVGDTAILTTCAQLFSGADAAELRKAAGALRAESARQLAFDQRLS